MSDGFELRFCVAAAGDVRSHRPTGPEAKGGWFCLDGHLWIRKPPVLLAAVMLPPTDNAGKTLKTDVTFKLKTMALAPSEVSATTWAKVPEAQALIDGVARHIDTYLRRAIPSARATLPDAAPTLKDISLPPLVWPDSPTGRISRTIQALKRRLIWPGVATYQDKMRKQNRARNLLLKPFDITDHRAEEEVLRPDALSLDQRLDRFVQRLEGLMQPSDMDVVLTSAPDLASVDLDIAQTGRLDLLTGGSFFCRTYGGLDVLRLEGAERDAAIIAYVTTRLVVLARSFEASWTGPMPRLSVRLTLSGLPETHRAQLTVEPRGWGFGLAEFTVELPAIPVHFPDGIVLRVDPVEKGAPPSIGAEPLIRAKDVVRPIRNSLDQNS